MYDERRQHPRFPILLVAMAHTSSASFEVVCTNVSAGGAFLATRQALEPGSPIELELKPHGPEGPTVMLIAQVRYVVPRGSGGQPGFSVTWTEAHCPTSRLALEQVLRDILRVPRFRVVANGLGGRFRFDTPMAEDEPDKPARAVFAPPAPPSEPTESQVIAAEATVDDWPLGDDSAAADPYAAVLVHEIPAELPPEPEEAPRAAADDFGDLGDLAAFAIGDDLPDASYAETALDVPDPGESTVSYVSAEAETMELSAALAARLADGLAAPAAAPAATLFDDPAFEWADFADVAVPGAPPAVAVDRDTAETLEISVARLLAGDAAGVMAVEGTSPAASYRLDEAPVSADGDVDDFGFAASDAPAAAPPAEDDYFPDHIPEPEPVQRITRNTVMRRLSGGFDSAPAAPPAAPNSLESKPIRAKPPVDEDTQVLTAAMAATSRPTSSLTRTFLAKMSTGEHGPAQSPVGRTARAPRPELPSETSTYADHDAATHRAQVQRQTDEVPDAVRAASHAPMASAPHARPPARGHIEIADARQPMTMVDAGQEVPRVMTESTVAYTRESQAIGPLLHAQTWPIEGDWPEMIPPSLSERYGYLEHIGAGGHGIAYRAVDLHLNRTVVLKFLAQSAMSTELARKYFLREVKMAASLNHPNIVHIYDIGKVDDVLYYAMEYVDGVPLSAYLPLREPIRDWQFLYSAIAQLCDALDHAHGQQILHRDIKPDNVLVAADGVVKLFDFGLARVADEGFGEQSVLIGTPHYMAPEQLMGGRVDHRTDIYALGVMVFRLVTGVLPFQDGNIFAAHAVEPVPDPRMFNPALPAAIVPVIEKAMAKRPADRYSSSREFAHDLYAALFGSPLG